MTPQDSIHIQVVTNGFLVTNPRQQLGVFAPDSMVVYTRLADLQAHLPLLLQAPDVVSAPIVPEPPRAVAIAPVRPSNVLEYATLVKDGGPVPGLTHRPCIIVDRGDSTQVRYWREPRNGHTNNKAAAYRYTVKSAYDWLFRMESKDRDECYTLEVVTD